MDFKKIITNLNIKENDLIQYGNFYKFNPNEYIKGKINGKLVLITALTPTHSGEGKTTIAIGLHDALNSMKKKAILTLREPSIGPVFGTKGTATGGGKTRLQNDEEINLNFTGDMYAIDAANNLISSVIDNEIYWDSLLNIDEKTVNWRRSSNINERSLRNLDIILKKSTTRKEEFVITPACNIMVIFTVSSSIEDFKERLDNYIFAYSKNKKPLKIKELNVTNAVLSILNNAFMPNIAFTAENNPVFVHGGAFANVSVGTNTVLATKSALSLSDYTITECGFGSDLGFEKYINIIAKQNLELMPKCVVIVVTIKALLFHNDFENDFAMLKCHVQNVKRFNFNLIVAINIFGDEKKDDIKKLENFCVQNDINYEYCDSYKKGSDGAKELANKVINLTKKESKVNNYLDSCKNLKERLELTAKSFYNIKEVGYDEEILDKVKIYLLNDEYKDYALCFIKSPNFLSGSTNKDKITVKGIDINTATRYFLIKLNDVFLMPGLGKEINAKKIKYDIKNKKVESLK